MPRLILVIGTLVLLAACSDSRESTPPPDPVSLDPDATGHYCGMLVANHLGPKAQIILDGDPGRIYWFTSVRDAITFTLLPEEPRNIAAIYVTDTGRSEWEHPENSGIWVDAEKAFFVTGSRRMGGMGKPEAIPFSEQESALAFSREYGGQVVGLSQIPRDYILN